MGKKKPREMAKQHERFVEGAVQRGIDRGKAEEVFALMAEFAGYGFAKSHSTAYALITYQTAYLKANHPREYLAALLTTEAGNHDKLARYIAHAEHLGVDVLPPSVNESAHDFTVVAEGIRFGLAGVKNVGEGAIESILQAREEGGAFASIVDFASRVDARRANRRVVESLVKCGAFDALHENRAGVWASLDSALEAGAAAQRDRAIGQENLFCAAGVTPAPEAALTDAPPWTDRQRLEYEKEVLGFYVTGHPLSSSASLLRRFATVTAADTEQKIGREVRAGGLITSLRETRTRRGARMAFATLEDLEGSFDLVIFAEPYTQHENTLKTALAAGGEGGPQPLLVSGDLEAGDPPKILVRDVLALERAEETLSTQLRIQIRADEATEDRLTALRSLLEDHPGDCAVTLHIVIPEESETVVAISAVRGVRPDAGLRQGVDELFGRSVTEVEI
jgi:DNA polymerase-3 subunit alpha